MATATITLTFPDILPTMSNGLLSLVMVEALLEPEEITAVAQGKISQADLLALLPDRLPGGGNFSAARLTRAMGVRNSAEDLKAFYEVFTAAS